MSLTRRITFDATHRFHRDDWDVAKNLAVFGDGAGPAHGHTYTCDVTVTGPLDETTGMVVDLHLFDSVLQATVLQRFSGTALHDTPEFRDRGLVTTGENFARLVAELVQGAMSAIRGGVAVSEVRVAENETLSATWRAAP